MTPHKECEKIAEDIRKIMDYKGDDSILFIKAVAGCLFRLVEMCSVHFATDDELRQLVKEGDEYESRQKVIDEMLK